MKITPTILHIPPYISTSWIQVRAIYMKENNLIVSLQSDEAISIPGLPKDILEVIFNTYSTFLDQLQQRHLNRPIEQGPNASFKIFPIGAQIQDGQIEGKHFPIMKMNLNSIDSINESMQHDSSLADTPDLPQEILHKIAEITRIIAADDIAHLPKAELHCNCPHCQIARAIHGETPHHSNPTHDHLLAEMKGEEVSEQELKFQQWDIKQAGEKLYCVTNRLDTVESYNVFLGDPVGCTCGNAGCEHILAVLKS